MKTKNSNKPYTIYMVRTGDLFLKEPGMNDNEDLTNTFFGMRTSLGDIYVCPNYTILFDNYKDAVKEIRKSVNKCHGFASIVQLPESIALTIHDTITETGEQLESLLGINQYINEPLDVWPFAKNGKLLYLKIRDKAFKKIIQKRHFSWFLASIKAYLNEYEEVSLSLFDSAHTETLERNFSNTKGGE